MNDTDKTKYYMWMVTWSKDAKINSFASVNKKFSKNNDHFFSNILEHLNPYQNCFSEEISESETNLLKKD